MGPKQEKRKQPEAGPSGQHTHPKRLKTGTPEKSVCDTCEEFELKFSQGNLGVVITVDLITLLTNKGKSLKNTPEVGKFFQAINAFLNTREEKEAEVIIHTENPHLLGEFDKKVDDKLLKLIPDGSLYNEIYERFIYDKNHVVFNVTLRKVQTQPSTNEFCTKVSVNKGIVDPTHAQMKRLFESKSGTTSKGSGGKTLPQFFSGRVLEVPARSERTNDKVPFQESYKIQAKPAKNTNRLPKTQTSARLQEQIRIWWEEHNLPHYISAFTKQAGGGSILLGVREDIDASNKSTGWFRCQGPVLDEKARKTVEGEILGRVENDMRWSDGFRKDVVQVNFCPVENGEEGECVVEVAVNQYPGLSFFDKDGPRSYKLNGNKPSPYGFEEWRKLMSATTTEEKDSKQPTKAKKEKD